VVSPVSNCERPGAPRLSVRTYCSQTGGTRPAPDVSLEKAMQFIKGGFSFRLKSKLDVWERSFNESQIMNQEKFRNCIRYIEENPVRRGLVSTPQAHPFSSAACGPLDPMPLHLHN